MKRDRIDIIMENAKAGDPKAMGRLANCFYSGSLVQKSYKSAWYWAFKASIMGDAQGKQIYEALKPMFPKIM